LRVQQSKLDGWWDADSFQTLTINGHVRNCQQQQVPIVHQECGSSQDSAGGLRTDNLAEVVLLETKCKHLLAAARPSIDQHYNWLAPLHIFNPDPAQSLNCRLDPFGCWLW